MRRLQASVSDLDHLRSDHVACRDEHILTVLTTFLNIKDIWFIAFVLLTPTLSD